MGKSFVTDCEKHIQFGKYFIYKKAGYPGAGSLALIAGGRPKTILSRDQVNRIRFGNVTPAMNATWAIANILRDRNVADLEQEVRQEFVKVIDMLIH